MAFDNLIDSIIQDFFTKNENFLFLSVPENLMNQIPLVANVKKENVIDLAKEYSPLKPFMKIIQHNKPSEEIINANTYKILQQFFKSYLINDEIIDRKDMVVYEEINFEKSSIKSTVSTLFSEIVQGNWIIKNAQELSLESINILKEISSKKINSKMIFCFNNYSIDNSSQHIIDFLNLIGNNSNFYEINDSENLTFSDEIECVEVPKFEILYKYLKSCRIFLDLTQGLEISKWINSNIDNFSFTIIQKQYLYLEMGIVSLFSGNTDEASFYLNNVVQKLIFDDEELMMRGILFMVQVMHLKNSFISALKYVNIALQHLANKKDSHFYALAYMMEYRISERNQNKNIFEKYKNAQKYLNDCGLYNNALNVSLSIPWQDVNNAEGHILLKGIVENTIEESKKNGNLFLLSSAYHWYGILISYIKNNDECLEWYSKCNEIRSQLEELCPIVQIRNGLAYEQLMRVEYKKAYDLINSFLDKIIDLNDYSEIIITLCNMGKILMYSRHFDEAYKFFQKVMKLQHIFGMETVTYNTFVPTYSDVLILKTFIEIINGELIHSKINISNIEKDLTKITSSYLPMIDFYWSIIYINEKNIEKAETYFDSAFKKINNLGNSFDYLANFITYEFSTVLEKKGYEDLSKKYFKIGLELAKKKGFKQYIFDENKLNAELYLSKYEKFDPIKLNLDTLMEKAEKERLMSQLHKRLRDSQFLNRIMSFVSDKTNEENYINNVAHSIFDYMMADSVMIAFCENNKWNVKINVSRVEKEDINESKWEELFNKSVLKKIGTAYFDLENKLIYANISKYEFIGAVIIKPSKNINFTVEDLDIINVALSSLQAQIVMMKQNEHLLFISSTDQLSMLKNRRALQEQLSIQSEMIRRYSKKRDMYFQSTIVFIDMDNFKYYNDTFGHEAGDFLISRFGQLLKDVFRKVDFVSRFGGDEFVALLPNTNCQEAKRAAERIHEALEKADYFIPDLCQILEKNVIIPDNKFVGFSTGICSNFDIDDQTKMDDVMVCADHALYYAKQHKKGSVIIWSDIKDLINEEEINKNSLENR